MTDTSPYCWRSVGGSIWSHKTRDDDVPLYDQAAIDAAVNAAIARAPIAVMDTRTVLGLCALTEAEFPALYALRGHRVALIDLGPNVKVEPHLPAEGPK